jgi:hypothetical protein
VGEAQTLVSEITGMLSDEVTHPVKVILFPANIYIGAIVQLTCNGDPSDCMWAHKIALMIMLLVLITGKYQLP